MNPSVQKVIYKSPHLLMMTFPNNETKQFDLNKCLHYPVYESLQFISFSASAGVKNGTVVWNDEIDFDPDTRYLEGEIVGCK